MTRTRATVAVEAQPAGRRNHGRPDIGVGPRGPTQTVTLSLPAIPTTWSFVDGRAVMTEPDGVV